MRPKSCWLNNFNLEYIQADFNHDGTRIHKTDIRVKVVAYTGKKRKFDIGKKDAQDRNNARNRDAFSVTKANHILAGEKEMIRGSDIMKSTNPQEIEDVLISIIDLKKELKKD